MEPLLTLMTSKMVCVQTLTLHSQALSLTYSLMHLPTSGQETL